MDGTIRTGHVPFIKTFPKCLRNDPKQSQQNTKEYERAYLHGHMFTAAYLNVVLLSPKAMPLYQQNKRISVKRVLDESLSKLFYVTDPDDIDSDAPGI